MNNFVKPLWLAPLALLGAFLSQNWPKTPLAVANEPLPAITIENTSIIEGTEQNTSANFVVSLSKTINNSVTVNWKTATGAAREQDYQASEGTLTFAPGETSQIISVPVFGDAMDEEDEAFYVLLSSPFNGTLGRGRAIGTIQDDDPPPSIAVDNASAREGDTPPHLPGGNSALFRLHLSSPSGKIVRVSTQTQDASDTTAATANEDYTPLPLTQTSFNVGSDTAWASIKINGDLRNEANETFFLNLSQPINATVANPQAQATILDDDRAPALSAEDVVTDESSGFARFGVNLSSPSGQTVSVAWRTVDGTALAPQDYTSQSGTLTFAPGETYHTFEVPVSADLLNEPTENFYILLSSSANASIRRARGMATVFDGKKIVCPPLTKIRFLPRPGYASRLLSGQFYGSNAGPGKQLQFITSITMRPIEGQWNEIVLPKPLVYRFLKFEAPANSSGGLAELEFWSNESRISGKALGSPSAPDSVHTFDKAFDANSDTYFEGQTADNQWVALDLGADKQAQPPVFTPPSGTYPGPLSVLLNSATPNAKFRVTRGGETIFRNIGGDPTRDVGENVVAPLVLDKSSVLSAIAYTDYLAASPAVAAAYKLPDLFAGIRTFHVGNSLTFGMDRFLQPLAQSAGKPLDYHRFTHSGAATDYLWDHPGDGFGDTHYAEAFQVLAPINHIFTQPFAGRDKSIKNEAEFSQKFYDLVRQNSPNAQAWLYAQWPDKSMAEKRTQGLGSALPLHLPKPITWQDGVANNLKFIEAVRDQINQKYTGKPVLIVPAGSALATLKTEIDAGRVPGLTDFWTDISADGLHLQPRGNYMVACVFFSCLFHQTPEGKVSALDSGLTPEQAAIFQRIAWQTARNYPLSGIQP